MFNKLFKKHQSILIGLGIFVLMMLAVSCFSLSAFGNHHHAVYVLSTWLNQHKLIVILWHILLITSIYFGWGIKVDLAVKHAQIGEMMDEKRVKKLKRFRWVLIGMVLIIDFFMFL